MENKTKTSLRFLIPFILLLAFVSVWAAGVAAIAFGVAWYLWRKYQWEQLEVALNPDFQRLIECNQGQITVADLTLATGISGEAADWFLRVKARDYGIQAIAHEDSGVLYYFLTCRAVAGMCHASEPGQLIPDKGSDLSESNLTAAAIEPT